MHFLQLFSPIELAISEQLVPGYEMSGCRLPVSDSSKKSLHCSRIVISSHLFIIDYTALLKWLVS